MIKNPTDDIMERDTSPLGECNDGGQGFIMIAIRQRLLTTNKLLISHVIALMLVQDRPLTSAKNSY